MVLPIYVWFKSLLNVAQFFNDIYILLNCFFFYWFFTGISIDFSLGFLLIFHWDFYWFLGLFLLNFILLKKSESIDFDTKNNSDGKILFRWKKMSGESKGSKRLRANLHFPIARPNPPKSSCWAAPHHGARSIGAQTAAASPWTHCLGCSLPPVPKMPQRPAHLWLSCVAGLLPMQRQVWPGCSRIRLFNPPDLSSVSQAVSIVR